MLKVFLLQCTMCIESELLSCFLLVFLSCSCAASERAMLDLFRARLSSTPLAPPPPCCAPPPRPVKICRSLKGFMHGNCRGQSREECTRQDKGPPAMGLVRGSRAERSCRRMDGSVVGDCIALEQLHSSTALTDRTV